MKPFLRQALAMTGLLLAPQTHAQSILPPENLVLDDRIGLHLGQNWQMAGALAGDPRRDPELTGTPGHDILVNRPSKDAKSHLVTTWTHGDIDLDFDFLMAKGSNSGVYLQGRYEVQLFDSWGVKKPTPADCGGIYDRWDASRGKGNESYGGTAPLANASRAPGLWQHLRIEFEAPRFDSAGQKIKNARFKRVVLNGYVIQENVEISGPTRSALFEDEQPLGPLMIQGDHGPMALRSISYKRFDPEAAVQTEEISYQLYPGLFRLVGEYDDQAPASQGSLPTLNESAVEKSGRFALVFKGTIEVPRDGDYAFSAGSNGSVRLIVDDKVVVTPLERGAEPGTIKLAAGRHSFRLDHLHPTGARPILDLLIEGPGIAPRSLVTQEVRPSVTKKTPPILIEVSDQRVRMQRGFVPFDPKKRLYATNVGTPEGIHFAYDFEAGAMLRVWRGAWLDTTEMWEGRGESQLARPNGPALTLNAKPTVTLIENPRTASWPDQPDALASSQGYTLDQNGLPTFHSRLADLTITDRIAPAADGSGLERTFSFSGTFSSWETFALLAEAEAISAVPGGGWVVGDRLYYIDLPKDSPHRPVLQQRNGRAQLVVRVNRSTLTQPLVYALVW